MSRNEKRNNTMTAKYGPDWRKVIANKSLESRLKNSGKTLEEIMSELGTKGGTIEHKRGFTDKKIASEAGKKGMAKRWGNGTPDSN